MLTFAFFEGMEAGFDVGLFTSSLWVLLMYFALDLSVSDGFPRNFSVLKWVPGPGFVRYEGGL